MSNTTKKTIDEFAMLITGNEHRYELTKEQEEIARESGLVVCFGASDDLLELRGLIYDEVDAYEGGTAHIIKKKGGKIDIIDSGELEQIEDLIRENELDFSIPTVQVESEWCPSNVDCSWLLKANVHYA